MLHKKQRCKKCKALFWLKHKCRKDSYNYKTYDKYAMSAIIFVAICSLIDISVTIYCLEKFNFQEVNPIANYLFNTIGYIPTYFVMVSYLFVLIPGVFWLGKILTIKRDKLEYDEKVRRKHFIAMIITISLMYAFVYYNNFSLLLGELYGV